MRKLIEITQENIIECDNKECDFVIPNTVGDPTDTAEYTNMPCPKCGENLLTEEDYINTRNFLKTVAWVNKWFSWITIFIPKKAKVTHTEVKVHNGITIKSSEELFVDCNCMYCGENFKGPEPKMCCNGRDCGCMGLPTDPVVCSEECYDALMNKFKK